MIRNAVKEDAEKILAIYSYYVKNTAISFEHDVPSLDEFQGRIVRTLERYPYLVLEEKGVILGYEVSIYVERHAKGRGYGRMLYEALETALKKAGILNLYACIADPVTEDEYLTRNSEHFHSHLGYTKVGRFHNCGYKFNRWYNMIWMEKIIGEHQKN